MLAQQGMCYSTALQWLKVRDSRLSGPSGTIIVDSETNSLAREKRAAIYGSFSSAEHKENLERQIERLEQYFTVRGYQVAQISKEIASGVNDSVRRGFRCSKTTRPPGLWSNTKAALHASISVIWKRCENDKAEQLKS